MGILGILGGAGAAILGVLFGYHQQQQPPPPAKIHVKPAQQSTNNNTVSQNPNQQQTGTNTNTQNVGGVSFATNVYVGCNTRPQEALDSKTSMPQISVQNAPTQTQTNNVEQTHRSIASQETVCKDEVPQLQTASGYGATYFRPVITIGVVAIATGAYAFYKMRAMEKYLYKDRKLFNWNRSIATQDLKGMDTHIIGPVLASFVQQRYSIEKIMENYSPPVIRFLNKLNKEENKLKQYLKAAKVFKTLYINNILGILDRHIKYAEDSLVRLDVMKKIIETWSAQMHTELKVV